MARAVQIFRTLLVLLASAGCAEASTETTIYGFKGGADTYFPESGVVVGRGGALYGVSPFGGASGKGAVYELRPPAKAGGAWVERVIHTFTGDAADGAGPQGRLWFDAASGALYGTTLGGPSGVGNVFRLAPPAKAGGTWALTVLYRFKGDRDGANPVAGLVRGKDGTFYGTTNNGGVGTKGTVFALSPPTPSRPKWTERLLATFAGGTDGSVPVGGVALDAAGNLYGTTLGGGAAGQGTVYRLRRPASATGAWTKTLLYSFGAGDDGHQPQGELLVGPGGVLYGTASAGGGVGAGPGYGMVFALAPGATAAAAWKETVVWRFKGGDDGAGPQAGLLRDAKGALYGVTSRTAFKLTPVGSSWRESVLHVFGTRPDGTLPWCTPVKGADGALYGTTMAGGPTGLGTVFRLVP